MAQINARLSPDFRARFDEYASEVGLDAAELARLLIVREMRVRRILRRAKGNLANVSQDHRKLTAHFHDLKSVLEFDRYARSQGLSRAAAAKLIFERELTEMWLMNAFAWSPRPRGPRH